MNEKELREKLVSLKYEHLRKVERLVMKHCLSMSILRALSIRDYDNVDKVIRKLNDIIHAQRIKELETESE